MRNTVWNIICAAVLVGVVLYLLYMMSFHSGENHCDDPFPPDGCEDPIWEPRDAI